MYLVLQAPILFLFMPVDIRACPLLIQPEPVKIDSYFLPTRNISRSYTSTEVNHSPLYISASFNEFYSMISPVGNIQVFLKSHQYLPDGNS